ncbi:hypothetical protein, variant [Blastomyces dermatitidis ER-3]|uniref:DUF7624 domain-containing protein n=3 Tax=Blastomyces TaxID=229219 RepID=A0A179UN78_BLAGS|nr:hypothetical protein, variant [Blastomyces gilchristii SLH14081]XP_045281729.1 hypothetical protein, variant [Blastomyces dermatitidis ER-3]EQL29852.1 hypothetical protein, variant [Blastomyces dermatitidis ATCC 26199]KMW67235.1 hypothetical protein, variant [Blastomyces dermatitidis ATCC 18188]OAT02002.1 hypothetical protein, variant [Blastomyces dermatitidis ER-3]OAT09293.1 hypothetical protein, variant [Blastomyces gilchristii SLH14081]
MLAVRSPASVSSGNQISAFSPYSASPSSPTPYSMQSDRPPSTQRSPSPSQMSSNSKTTEFSRSSPKAFTPNGLDPSDNQDGITNGDMERSITRTGSALSIRTSGAGVSDFKPSSDEDDAPQSVIHVPSGFGKFLDNVPSPRAEPSRSSSALSDVTVTSPLAGQNDNDNINNNKPTTPVSPPPITTTHIAPPEHWSDRTTPRAQTRQEVEDFKKRARKSNLEDIPETFDVEQAAEDTEDEPETLRDMGEITTTSVGKFEAREHELKALRTALSECWTLCNTLASLSYIHRERLFNFSGKGDMQEQAWKSCWKLCQNLYENRDNDDHHTYVRPTLDLCRDFCQALFEVRVRDNEVTDSVLRVSFELNNHLYNTHDRNLPEAFRHRTLDFYITLCHRLMKQRTRLAKETDTLLKACWSLAEMLFSLRQRRREGKSPDEELLGSAIQACWELCDLFRQGWTQIRPDRGTPRPSQTTFTQAFYQAKRSEYNIMSDEDTQSRGGNPETPTTIFEDTATVSPEEAHVPNILLLNPSNNQVTPPKWSSNSSTLSGYSQSSSGKTASSNNTVKSPAEDPNLTCLKLLIIRAAMNSGFQRGTTQTLSAFVKSLSSDSFGTQLWQRTLLDNYKKLVVFDSAFRDVAPSARAGAVDVANAVRSMVQHNGQYIWLQDLYRLVFGFHTEEAMHRKSVTVQT